MHQNLHATALIIGEHCVLLTGNSGCGKSSLALMMLKQPPEIRITNESKKELICLKNWQLLADDQVFVSNDDCKLFATCHGSIFGKIEIRGSEIFNLPDYLLAKKSAKKQVRLICNLIGGIPKDRIDPEENKQETIFDCSIPRLNLYGEIATWPGKIALYLEKIVG